MQILNLFKNLIKNFSNNTETDLKKSIREIKYSEELLEIKNYDLINRKSLLNKNYTFFEYIDNVGYSNFIAGNFYVVKNSEPIFSKKNVFNYELFEINIGKKPINISKLKYQKKSQETIIDNFPENYLLFVEYCEKVPYKYNLMPCDSSNTYSWSNTLKIYYNGKLLKEIKDKVYKWKVNTSGEILLYHNDDIVKINLKGLQQKISVENNLSLPNEHYIDKTYSDQENLYLYFYEKECELCYMLKSISKNAKKFEIIPNKFKDDIETVNYKAIFDKNDIDTISLLYFILEKYSYGEVISSLNIECKHCFGTAINRLAIEIYPKLLIKNNAISTIRYHEMLETEIETNKNIIENIYNYYNLEVNYNCYPKEFFNDVATINGQLAEYKKYLMEIKPTIFLKEGYLKKNSKDKLQKEYEKLKSELVYNGIIKRKWSSEIELYKLVKTYYKDAIYQYHTKWLGQQSLDIFIPSLNIGIEYQGKQHYEPVNIFGGIEGYRKTVERDKNKKILCQINKINLIEWKYDEMISKIQLQKKINEINN